MGEAKAREQRYQGLAETTDQLLVDALKDMEAAAQDMGFGPVLAGATTALVRRTLASLPPERQTQREVVSIILPSLHAAAVRLVEAARVQRLLVDGQETEH